MKKFLRIALFSAIGLMPISLKAQQYTGIDGMIHTPSAEMHHEGDARLGSHFLNKAMTPDVGFDYLGDKYNTFNYYLAITPYSWLEMSYTCTERLISRPGDGEIVYGGKDRYFSVKVRPIEEGKYWPAVAVGMNDVGTTVFNPNNENSQLYFTNYYVAVTKHFTFNAGELCANLAFRQYFRDYNAKWNGLVGAVAFRPAFLPQARAILEYTGNEIQIGFDAVIWRHIVVQASLKDFKYPNFGICLQTNLLGKNHK